QQAPQGQDAHDGQQDAGEPPVLVSEDVTAHRSCWGPRHGPPVSDAKGTTPPSGSPGIARTPLGEAVARLGLVTGCLIACPAPGEPARPAGRRATRTARGGRTPSTARDPAARPNR